MQTLSWWKCYLRLLDFKKYLFFLSNTQLLNVYNPYNILKYLYSNS